MTYYNQSLHLLLLTLCLLSITSYSQSASNSDDQNKSGLISANKNVVNTFTVFELTLRSTKSYNNPYLTGPILSAIFEGISGEASGKVQVINSFWDGGNVWKIRFSPTYAGVWRYTVNSSENRLNGITGNFKSIRPTPTQVTENPLLRGFLKTDGFGLKLSDGTPFLLVGDSQWSFLEEFTLEEIKEWIDTLAKLGLNSLHGSVWLAKYDRAGISPFKNRDPRTDQLDVAYFKKLDEILAYGNSRGIMFGLAVGGFPENSRWYKLFGTQERHTRWFQYVINRYSAYNIRWLLFGEINDAGTPWGWSWQQSANYYAQLVKELDPYQHPLGSHATRVDTHSATNRNIDYIEVQIERDDTQYRKVVKYRQWNKPILLEEYWYEPKAYDNDVMLGIENTYRNFIAGLGYPTMGSLMRAHSHHRDFPPHRRMVRQSSLKAYLLEHDKGLILLSKFKENVSGLDTSRFIPFNDICSRGICSQFGDDFAIYLKNGGTTALDLSKRPGFFTVHIIDIYTGKRENTQSIMGGRVQTIDSQSENARVIIVNKMTDS